MSKEFIDGCTINGDELKALINGRKIQVWVNGDFPYEDTMDAIHDLDIFVVFVNYGHCVQFRFTPEKTEQDEIMVTVDGIFGTCKNATWMIKQ